MSESVYILGGGRTDFKRNLKKEGKTIRHIIIEAGKKAIDDAKIDPGEIQAGAVGNFNAGQFTKQLQLGAFIPEIDPKLRGIPTMHTEAACASGALSVLLGAQWIIGGFYDVVLVVGAEQQKTMSSLDGSDVLGAAADYHNEKPEYGDFMFPKLFGRIAQIYIEKYGATEADLARVAWKNYAHAKLNPLAQMRDADLTFDCASQVSDKNPSVAPPLSKFPIVRRSPMARHRLFWFPENIWIRSAAIGARLRDCLGTVTRPIICRSTKKMRQRFRPRAKRRRKLSEWQT